MGTTEKCWNTTPHGRPAIAVDILTKPFAMKVLAKRVRAVISAS